MAEEPREEEPREEPEDDGFLRRLLRRMDHDPVGGDPPDHVYETYPGSVDTLLLDNVKYHLYPVQMPANTIEDRKVAVLKGRIYANSDNGIMVWTFGANIIPEVLVGGEYYVRVEHPEWRQITHLHNFHVPIPTNQEGHWQLTKPSSSGCFLWTATMPGARHWKRNKSLRIHIPENTIRIGALRFWNEPYIGKPYYHGGYLPPHESIQLQEGEPDEAEDDDDFAAPAQAEGVQGQQGADQQALIQQLQAQQEQMRWTDQLVQVHQERLDRLTEQLLPVQLEQLNQQREQLQAQQGEIADLRQLLENVSRVLLDTRVDLTQQDTEQQEQIRQLTLIADQHQNDIQQTRQELAQQETDQGQRMSQLMEAVMEEIQLLRHQQPLPSSNHQ